MYFYIGICAYLFMSNFSSLENIQQFEWVFIQMQLAFQLAAKGWHFFEWVYKTGGCFWPQRKEQRENTEIGKDRKEKSETAVQERLSSRWVFWTGTESHAGKGKIDVHGSGRTKRTSQPTIATVTKSNVLSRQQPTKKHSLTIMGIHAGSLG